MPPLVQLRSTLFLVGLCVFGAGLLCSLVQRHQRLDTLLHASRRLSQVDAAFIASGEHLQRQLHLASTAGSSTHSNSVAATTLAAATTATAVSVEKLVAGDRRHLVQAVRHLVEQAAQQDSTATVLQPNHLHPAVGSSVNMMGSRGIMAGPIAQGLTSSFRNMWASYNRALLLRPLATKIATGVVGTIIGDGVAQYSTHRLALYAHNTGTGRSLKHKPPQFQYDFPRLLRLLAWSALIGTPIAHCWFNFLDSSIMPHAPTSMKAVICKLILDQGFMAPLGTSLFFVSMKVMEGQPERAIPEVRSKLWPCLLANWTVWPLANAINFALIPPSQRILYVNVLAIAWSAFMSHMANKPAAPGAAAVGKGVSGGASPTSVHAHAHVHHGHHQQHGLTMRALEPSAATKAT